MAVETDETAAEPSLRERRKAETRQAILDAVTLIELAHGGVSDPELFTFANIARVAGVSERTVYRVFPNRAALDEAVAAEQGLRAGDVDLTDLDTWGPAMRAEMRYWSHRAGGGPVDAPEREFEGFPASLAARDHRDDVMLEAMSRRPGAAPLGPRQRRACTAAVRSVISVRTMAQSALRWGLTLEEAGEAHAWAYETLLAALDEHPPTPWGLDP